MKPPTGLSGDLQPVGCPGIPKRNPQLSAAPHEAPGHGVIAEAIASGAWRQAEMLRHHRLGAPQFFWRDAMASEGRKRNGTPMIFPVDLSMKINKYR